MFFFIFPWQLLNSNNSSRRRATSAIAYSLLLRKHSSPMQPLYLHAVYLPATFTSSAGKNRFLPNGADLINDNDCKKRKWTEGLHEMFTNFFMSSCRWKFIFWSMCWTITVWPFPKLFSLSDSLNFSIPSR